jgi:hypothetical protein
MEASKYPGAHLLLKYIHGDITEQELHQLHRYMEESPVLKRNFEELADPKNVRDRLRHQYNLDREAAWQKFKNGYLNDRPSLWVAVKNFFKPLYKPAAAVLIVLLTGLSVYYIILSKRTVVADMQPDPNLFKTDSVAFEFTTHGYLDIAGVRKLDLDRVPVDTIEWGEVKILNQGALVTIRNKTVAAKKYSAKNMLVTADKRMILQLPDGSRVTLNKNSFIIFPLQFDGKERRVGLYGEAYFDVASNPKVPFVVQTKNQMLVNAYGTSFTVTSYGQDECSTTLLKGSVTVSKDGQKKVLTEGERLQITNGKPEFRIDKPDMEKEIAWTKKELDFKKVGFQQMMIEIGKLYGYKIEFKGELPKRNYDISLNSDVDLNFLINSTEQNDSVTILKTTDKLVVIGKQ